MPTIDGDAHVMEGPQTWEYCDPSERKFMPVLLNPGPEADRQFWLVDGKIRGHVRHVIKPKDFHALAQASGRDMVVPPEAFRYTKGAAKPFKRSDLDNAVTREFCPECGTHLATRPARQAEGLRCRAPSTALTCSTRSSPSMR